MWTVLDGDVVHSLADATVGSPSLADLPNERYRAHVQTLVDGGALASRPVVRAGHVPTT